MALEDRAYELGYEVLLAHTINTPEREFSVKQLITRVVDTITEAGISAGYFDGAESATAFQNDLKFLLVNQKVAFNSPVWFNVGCAALEPENTGGNWHWNAAEKRFEQTLHRGFEVQDG